jgi:precorrin-6B methylase 2
MQNVLCAAQRLRNLRVERFHGLSTPSEPYDAVVIGGGTCNLPLVILWLKRKIGPGGYVAAIKAAQLGLKVGKLCQYL